MIGDYGAEVQWGLLKAADHKSGRPPSSMGELGLRLPVFWHFRPLSATAPGLMVLTPAFVTPQTLFNPNRGLFRAVIGIRGHPFSLKQRTRVQVQHAFGPETEAVLPDGRVAGIAAAEIFRSGFLDP